MTVSQAIGKLTSIAISLEKISSTHPSETQKALRSLMSREVREVACELQDECDDDLVDVTFLNKKTRIESDPFFMLSLIQLFAKCYEDGHKRIYVQFMFDI